MTAREAIKAAEATVSQGPQPQIAAWLRALVYVLASRHPAGPNLDAEIQLR